MAQERINEIRELLFHLEKKIKPLEWDSSRSQINEFKQKQLEKLREEHKSLSSELAQLESPIEESNLKESL